MILDCDNTLCLSERLAFEACTDLTNEVLEKYGKSERYTVDQLLEDFVGHNFRGMLVGLQKKYNFTMSPEQLEEYVGKELDAVTKKLSEKCQPCPGAPEMCEWLKQQGYPMAVCSTSAKSRVVASIKKVGVMKYFSENHVYSAASMNPPTSKPAPDVYLWACKDLGVKPEEAVTVEDSKSGVTSATRAGVPCIAYVGVYGVEDSKEKMDQMAQIMTEAGAKVVMYDWKEFPECLKKIEG